MSKVKKPRNADHVRRKNAPTPSDEVIEARLQSLLEPAILGQQGYARLLGLRERILSFPVMVAGVLTLLWRQVASVCELSRVLAREDCLWAPRLKVSQQALSQRFLSFPAELFQRVLGALLPRLRQRWAERQRPLPAAVVHARQHFQELLIADGSTLEALFRKLKALQELPRGPLAGKICTVIDLASRLPRYVWFTELAQAHDTHFIDRILKVSRAGLLWVFDRGLYDFGFFERLIERGAAWITRSKSNLSYSVSQGLEQSDFIRDRLIRVEGCAPLLRLVEVRFERQWYRYSFQCHRSQDTAGLGDRGYLSTPLAYRRSILYCQAGAESVVSVDWLGEWGATAGVEHVVVFCCVGRFGRCPSRRDGA